MKTTENNSKISEAILVANAIADGCKPEKVYEMGEWFWWSCSCDDKRHSQDTVETYFSGRRIC